MGTWWCRVIIGLKCLQRELYAFMRLYDLGVTDPSQTTEYRVTQLVAQQELQQYRWCHVVVPDEVLCEVLGTDILKSGDQEFHELSRVALGLREAPL